MTPEILTKEREAKRFEVALHCWDKERDLFWKQATFFSVIVTGILFVYKQALESHSLLAWLISFLGAIVAVSWAFSSMKSYKLCKEWETKLKETSKAITGDLFDPDKKETDLYVMTWPVIVSIILAMILSFAFAKDDLLFWESQFGLPMDSRFGIAMIGFVFFFAPFFLIYCFHLTVRNKPLCIKNKMLSRWHKRG